MKQNNSAKSGVFKIIFAVLVFGVVLALLFSIGAGLNTAKKRAEELQDINRQLTTWSGFFDGSIYSEPTDPDSEPATPYDKLVRYTSLYVDIDTAPKSAYSEEQLQTADELLEKIMQGIEELEG